MFYKKSLGTGVVCRDGRCEHLRRISEYCELIANTSLRKQFTENYQEYKNDLHDVINKLVFSIFSYIE